MPMPLGKREKLQFFPFLPLKLKILVFRQIYQFQLTFFVFQRGEMGADTPCVVSIISNLQTN